MTLTIELPELVGNRIQETPEGMARARALLTREFSGIDLEAVASIRESFTEEGADMTLDDAFAAAEKKIHARQ